MNASNLDRVIGDDFSPEILEIPKDNRDKRDFVDWVTLKNEGFDTRTNWKYNDGLVPIRGDHSNARYLERKIYNAAEWKKKRAEVLRRHEDQPEKSDWINRLQINWLNDNRIEVITKDIPVWHRSQMREGNFRERTQAAIDFGNVFWRSAQSTNYIKKNSQPDKYDAKWFTKRIDQEGRFDFEPFQFFNERKLLEHLNQRNVYGIKADPAKPQWWCGIDLDLHVEKGGRPEIFLKQVEAVLSFLHGKGWIVCLGQDVVNGIHCIKILEKPERLKDVRDAAQNLLNLIADQNADLETEAVEAGMKPIRQAEIYPSATQGFRLPLGIGYTAITDRPLQLVKYHRSNDIDLIGADVVSFMNWDGQEMPLADKLNFITERVSKDRSDENAKIQKTIRRLREQAKRSDVVVAELLTDQKVLGPMKGRYRKVLVDFFSGNLQVPKSLQTGLLLGVNALWSFDFPVEQRADYLLSLLQDIKVTNPDFSSRLWDEDWDSIRDDVDHMVESNERLRADPQNPQIKKSNDILKRWAKAMKVGGFDFGDRSTWDRCWNSTEKKQIELREDEITFISLEIAPVFGCSPEIAIEAVLKMVRLAAIKDRNGDGMSQEYRRSVLTDLGIHVQDNKKLARCWNLVEEAGFIYTKQNFIFNSARGGRATSYGVGPRMVGRVLDVSKDEFSDYPEWLIEAVAGCQYRPDWFDWVMADSELEPLMAK